MPLSKLRRNVLPSIATISFKTSCKDLAQSIKHVLNEIGHKAENTRANVFFEGIPFLYGKYRLKNSFFSLPIITKSRQLSAPQIAPHKTINKISING